MIGRFWLRHIGWRLRRRARVRLRHVSAAAALLGSALVAGSSALPVEVSPTPLTGATVRHHITSEVVGYLPYWELDASTADTLDYGRLTTIVLFSVGMDRSGHLVTSGRGYRALMSDAATRVIDRAHAAGIRTLVSFTSFGSRRNARFFGSETAQRTFVDEAAALVAARGLDGADFDVEVIAGTWFDEYAATAGALASAMRRSNPAAYSTVATNANLSGARMAKLALDAGVDRAFLMGYNYRTAHTTDVGSIDPLVRSDGGLSLSSSLDLYEAAGVPLDTVLLGLPLYGRTWQTVDASVRSQPVAGAKGQLSLLRDLPDLRRQGKVLADDFDAEESSARLVREVHGKVYQTYYDSARSLDAKFGAAAARGLAGIGFWTLGYDGGSGDHWKMLPNAGPNVGPGTGPNG
jgi:spore germination protein YaaH